MPTRRTLCGEHARLRWLEAEFCGRRGGVRAADAADAGAGVLHRLTKVTGRRGVRGKIVQVRG
eukprot:scaffold85072_cov14-Tisochrysis_lutea.AAC.1